jgi:hypothetical protein
MNEYSTETYESYTGETQRLSAPPAYIVAPSTAQSPHWSSRLDPTTLAVCVAAFLMILALSRMPEAPQVVPMVDRHVEIFSRNCVGYCP